MTEAYYIGFGMIIVLKNVSFFMSVCVCVRACVRACVFNLLRTDLMPEIMKKR